MWGGKPPHHLKQLVLLLSNIRSVPNGERGYLEEVRDAITLSPADGIVPNGSGAYLVKSPSRYSHSLIVIISAQ